MVLEVLRTKHQQFVLRLLSLCSVRFVQKHINAQKKEKVLLLIWTVFQIKAALGLAAVSLI